MLLDAENSITSCICLNLCQFIVECYAVFGIKIPFKL